MDKILTISIASYNVEKYLNTCLDSLVAAKNIDLLDIIVVDDGSKDLTSEIAQDYVRKYPNSVSLIKKENGGYGTTVNASLKKARGKYFKLLDADDWVMTEELDKLVDLLKKIETDVVVSYYSKGSGESDSEIVDVKNVQLNKEYSIIDLNPIPTLGMWALTYKTKVLKDSKLELPGRLFYTDQIFCTIPFSVAKTIVFVPYNIYFYRIGRDGQSVSRESRIKNIDNTLHICTMLSEYIAQNKYNSSYRFMLNRVCYYYISALKTILLQGITSETIKQLKQYERSVKKINNDVFEESVYCGKFGKFLDLARKTNYVTIFILKLKKGGMPNWG